MVKFFRKLVILLLIFVFGVAGTAVLLNSETTDDRTDMNDPVLPEVMIQLGDTLANRMYGYKIKMQTDFTRDSITPIDTTRTITFAIDPYKTQVDNISYEIRTSDGNKVIENRKLKNLEQRDNYLWASVQVESDLLLNQEYSMQITLDTDQGTIYYYTRLIQKALVNAGQYVKFVKGFYEKCLDKTTADDLSVYIEPDVNIGSLNYANVTIHNTLSQISWGTLKPMLIQRGIPTIKDINETTASVSIDYQISARDNDSNVELYNVTEFYRMRYTDTRMMLLDFKRSARQIFSPKSGNVSEAGLLLGVREGNVDFMMNDEATTVAFVQEGELWTYTPGNGKTVRIFTLRRDTKSDFRDSWVRHDIKIIRISDSKDVDFVVSGYMSRGPHEGYSGICVYHYSSDRNVVEEKVFIPCTESPEFLKEDLGNLSYVNADNELFLLFAGRLYRVDINAGTYRVLEEEIDSEKFVVSDTSAHAAWSIETGNLAGSIRVIDFDMGVTKNLVPDEGCQYRVMGYMNEDLLYGLVRESDILTDTNGRVSEGIESFRIEDFEGNVKKDYSQPGLYVMNPVIRGTMCEFEMSRKTGDTYTFEKKDNIINNRKVAANQVAVERTYTSRTGTVVRLAFEDIPDTNKLLLILARMRSVKEHIISLDTREAQDEDYYVYAGGGLYGVYSDPAKAVKDADEQLGVVLNRGQQYIWERGNRKEQITLALEDVPRIFQKGVYDIHELQEGLGDEGTIVDLTGCSLSQVLYEISAQRAVVAKTGPDTSVVIVGYDAYNTWLLNTDSGEIYPYGMNDSTALFEQAGNIFLTYVEAVKADK